MSFLGSHPKTAEGFLSDGRFTVSYPELRQAAVQWNASLEGSLACLECVALPLRQDVPSAVALLALLARG